MGCIGAEFFSLLIFSIDINLSSDPPVCPRFFSTLCGDGLLLWLAGRSKVPLLELLLRASASVDGVSELAVLFADRFDARVQLGWPRTAKVNVRTWKTSRSEFGI